MKRILKICAVLMALMMMFLCACDSCSKEPNSSSESGSGTINNSHFPACSETLTVPYTNETFVNDGKSEYKIIISENYGEDEYFAAQEVNTFLLKSCGVVLDIKFDSEVEYTADSKYIVIGKTKFAETVNIVAKNSELGNYGFILRTVNKSIFIVGASTVGTGALNGTYEFLRYQLGLEVYASDEINYKTFSTVKLVDLDITDKPDIPGYIGGPTISNNSDFMRRMRVTNRVGVMGKGQISPYHNMLLWLPASEFYDEHPSWYNSIQSQLCLTAHGDEAEYQLMLETVFERMYDEVMTYDLDIVTWTLMDNWDPCTCSACNAEIEKYGTRAGKLVEFCNELSDMFKAKFEEEGIEKDLSIMFFAYYYYTAAPTKGNIKCNDNVYPIIAPLNDMDRTASIYHEKNAAVKENIDRWSELCDRFGFWIYSANFSAFFAPLDVITNMQENYAYFASKNPIYFFDQGGSSQFQENATCFTALKTYLNAKVAWDVDCDVSALTADFFVNYFKDASDAMYNYYVKYRMKLQMLFDEYGYSPNMQKNVFNTEFFEYGTLLSWKSDIDDAYKAIEKYKDSDPELFDTLDTRIRVESVCVNYMILKLYKSYYTSNQYNSMVSQLYADCEKANILSPREWRGMDEALS